MNVTVLDMQPIEPAVGGGRLRLLGLYHALGEGICATYVGTYDWPGEAYRRHMLSESLEEITIPLTEAHFQAADAARERVGKNVIDCVFHQQAHLSSAYVDQARKAAQSADVVVFSHPWIFPLVRDVLDFSRQLIVYDSHNVEGVLRTQLLDDNAGGTEVAREVVALEKSLCEAADLVLACSQQDRLQFAALYGVAIEKIKLIPNGVFVNQVARASAMEKLAAKAALGLDVNRVAAIFLGSPYGPNNEAASFIARELALQLPEITFVIAGGVGEALEQQLGKKKSSNLVITGQVDDKAKLAYLAASDIAINPMFGGSGTNIKMFDFMAAGLAIVTTPIGARGIATRTMAFLTCEKTAFAAGLRQLAQDAESREALGADARLEVERYYAWERISANLGALLRRYQREKAQKTSRPFFSVVVPTFERPQRLTRLLDLLAAQTDHDFEVIIVDQSEKPWPGLDLKFDLDMLYLRSSVRGAVSARNLGASMARGGVIAFIDDDCEPAPRWLASARTLLADTEVVGIEGLIQSSKLGDPEWRTVSNKGFHGIGFMTANLFVRTSCFNQLNGFDIAFEDPHFREDTDFGWRLQKLGKVPFSEEAWVYHPPHRRDIARESQGNRDKFFEKDVLLMHKHPARYRELLEAEGHWRETPGFWPNFLRGANKYGITPPGEIIQYLDQDRPVLKR